MAKKEPEIGFYMLNLWMASWHSEIAGTLENDEELLCDLAQCEPQRWPALREKVLTGWNAAGDLLVHPFVQSLASEAVEMERRRKEREKKRAQRGRDSEYDPPDIPAGHLGTLGDSPDIQEKTGQEKMVDLARSRATRLMANLEFPEKWRLYAIGLGVSEDRAVKEFEKMRNWSQYAKNGACKDWFRRWQNWLVEVPREAKIVPRETIETSLPDEPAARKVAEWICERYSPGAYRSWFCSADGKPLIRMNCTGVIIEPDNAMKRDRIQQQYWPAIRQAFHTVRMATP